jgi:hypothetical protein
VRLPLSLKFFQRGQFSKNAPDAKQDKDEKNAEPAKEKDPENA